MSFKSRNFKKTLALMLSVASIGGGAKNAANAAQKRGENSSQSQSWIAKNPGTTALIGILGLGTLAGGGCFVKNKFFSKNTKNNNNLGNDNVPNINIQPQIIETKNNAQNISQNIETQPIVNQTIENSVPDYEKIAKEEWDKMNLDEKNEFKNKKNDLKDQVKLYLMANYKDLIEIKKYNKFTEKTINKVFDKLAPAEYGLNGQKDFSNRFSDERKSRNCISKISEFFKIFMSIMESKYYECDFFSGFFDKENIKNLKDITTKKDLNESKLKMYYESGNSKFILELENQKDKLICKFDEITNGAIEFVTHFRILK